MPDRDNFSEANKRLGATAHLGFDPALAKGRHRPTEEDGARAYAHLGAGGMTTVLMGVTLAPAG
jgi:hypothetical protein